MNEILTSLSAVTSSQFFWFYMGLIITFGVVIGTRLDEGVKGFQRSMLIILPFLVVMIITNVSRIYQASFERIITPQAYNGTVSMVMTAVFYILGLFAGHMVSYKAKESVYKEKGLK